MIDLYDTIKSFFKTMCRYSLRIFQNFKGLESTAQKTYEQKGDIFTELKVSLMTAFDEFKSLRQNMVTFADAINLPLPIYENSEPKFLVDDDNIVFKAEIEFETDIYQDEVERDFYEKLPVDDSNETEVAVPDEWSFESSIEKNYESEEIDPEKLQKLDNCTA